MRLAALLLAVAVAGCFGPAEPTGGPAETPSPPAEPPVVPPPVTRTPLPAERCDAASYVQLAPLADVQVRLPPGFVARNASAYVEDGASQGLLLVEVRDCGAGATARVLVPATPPDVATERAAGTDVVEVGPATKATLAFGRALLGIATRATATTDGATYVATASSAGDTTQVVRVWRPVAGGLQYDERTERGELLRGYADCTPVPCIGALVTRGATREGERVTVLA